MLDFFLPLKTILPQQMSVAFPFHYFVETIPSFVKTTMDLSVFLVLQLFFQPDELFPVIFSLY